MLIYLQNMENLGGHCFVLVMQFKSLIAYFLAPLNGNPEGHTIVCGRNR